VIEAVIEIYLDQRTPGERFIDTVRRLGLPPFKAAADAQRHLTAAH
jgi:sulfite reductase (NADPH) hemoprotein beta-component